MTRNVIASRIAGLVRKHAQPNAQLPDLERDVAEIAALAVAAAQDLPPAVSCPVTLEWFKLANRAEIKLTAETTQALALALVAKRGQRVVLTFTDPDSVIGWASDVAREPAAQQLDLEQQIEKTPPTPSAQPEAVAQEMPDLPEQLKRKPSKKKVSPKPATEQVNNAPTAAPEVAEPWIPSVDEPGSYDPEQSPAIN